ncbi:ABC transporter ATP-binding protein [Sediminispirochaeta smaragdinae]|uniref:ABC transporter related protein n=1 Tax=Sediminispirochaeta smaragdinae (strain DSM 11293 / JCM 15392 / SEBR 4228) TaxID=573413 RepID=E1RA20_SEDSS|nr:ABC transporter ATP-binding protein [Sediminispirochaeta smaragdinae]ADK83339.1 ABC transporter related protein [Sediminispirochaeta smaragdinae DSM 11293]
MNSIALRVEHLTKEYRLGTIGYGTLREDLQSWWARVRGKEDPNSLVTAIHHSDSEQKHFLALDDISFEVKKGDRLGIIGRNGAGKSTLLKILSRITSPTKGNIYINGRVGSLLEVGTGFHQELTGRENIYLNGAILGMKRWEIDKKLDEIVAFAGVERFIDTPVKRYSSGMFVRLGFAVAAHLEPDILIVDEVLAVGDAEFQKKAIGKMEEVSNNQGRTILFVSHNMKTITTLCNKFLWLEQGMVKDFSSNVEIINQYLRNGRVESNISFQYKESLSKPFQLMTVSIRNKKGEDALFHCDEDIHVLFDYISRRPLKGLYGHFRIFSSWGDVVWVSDTYDSEKSSLDSLPEGTGTIDIKIPRRSLSPGKYQIEFSFASKLNETGFFVDVPGIVGYFRLVDNNTRRGNDRAGFFSTILEWEKIST